MRYFLGFLIAIGLLALVIILVVKGLSGNNSTAIQTKPLSSYANTDAVAGLVIDGPIVADQNYQQVQIYISQTYSQINIINGYQGAIVNTQTFENNPSAYSAFLSALQEFGFGEITANFKYKTPAGFCSFGDSYSYSLVNGGNNIINSWATSCGGEGNFKGIVSNVNQLFISQIPTYQKITANTSL
jgi:hypothetical protein